jgi:hypothetical protein
MKRAAAFVTVVALLAPLVEWSAAQPNPLQLAFCEAGQTPWPAA